MPSGFLAFQARKRPDRDPKMEKSELLGIIRKLLETDADLAFLQQLSHADLETLAACIRSRIDRGVEEKWNEPSGSLLAMPGGFRQTCPGTPDAAAFPGLHVKAPPIRALSPPGNIGRIGDIRARNRCQSCL